MVWDADTLEVLKTYTTERPVNSAAFSPLYDHVVLGGGQEAMDVTTTSSKSGKFDARYVVFRVKTYKWTMNIYFELKKVGI